MTDEEIIHAIAADPDWSKSFLEEMIKRGITLSIPIQDIPRDALGPAVITVFEHLKRWEKLH